MARKQIVEDEVASRPFDAQLTRKAFMFVLPYKRLFATTLLTLVLLSATNVIAPYITKTAIDGGIKNRDLTMLTTMAVLYLVNFIVRWFLQFWQSMAMTSLAQHVTNDIRHKMFCHIQSQSLDFFDKREVGRIISRLMGDVNSLNALIVSGALSLITDILTAIGVVYVMMRMSWKLTLLTFTLLPFILLVTILFRQVVRATYRSMRKKSATMTAAIAQNVSGVRVVKSFARERRNYLYFKTVSRELRRQVMSAVIVGAIYSNMVSIITVIGVSIVFWYGGLQVKTGVLTTGGFVAFIYYIGLFYGPVQSMSGFYTVLQAAMAGAERIFEILDTEPKIKNCPNAITLPKIRGRVEFRDVRFSYNPDTPILKGVSFVAEPGQKFALVGPTGAGKSTIINLLPRQYDIQSGEILVDGVDIRDVTLDSLRGQLGIVLQESFLFSGSVLENIRYGRLNATDEEIYEASKAVNAHDFIMDLPQGYKTDVKEGGSRLSTGQKQLVSFARALIANPKILVLDEATSSVDAETEQLIQGALRTLFKGRTSFAIAHRLSTILESDKILVIEAGQIVESGNHQELMARGGHYRHLYEAQFAQQEKKAKGR